MSLAAGASSAFAADIGHAYLSSFGGSGTNALGTPTGVDVDNSGGASAGDVYVADSQNHRVEKFDAAGNFILMWGDEVNQTNHTDICTAASGNTCKAGNGGGSAEQLGYPAFVAVDDSSSPSKGDVYVGDQENSTIHKYDENGNLLTGWGSGGQMDGSSSGNGAFGFLGGIDVDSAGNLITWDVNQARISKFSQSGSFSASYAGEGEGICRGNDGVGVAVAPNGAWFYKVNGDDTISRMEPPNEEHCYTISLDGQTRGLNTDPVTGTLYQVREEEVEEYKFDGTGQPLDEFNAQCPTVLNRNSGCAASHRFGSGDITAGRGVGVNATTKKLYVADFGNHEVDVFIPATAPLVKTGDPVANTTVSGEADPDGAGNVTECYFEFGPSAPTYGSKVGCSPAPEYSSAQAVTAVLPGLNGEQTYHYRLVAKGAGGGTNFGLDKTITPHNVKGLKTEPATDVSRTGAELHGSFEGNGEETHYYFEWGLTESYGEQSAVPPGPSAGSPTFPPVTALPFTLTGLLPETTYHFHVVAENHIGVSPGKDLTFTTLPAVQSLTTEAATAVAPRSATLNASFVGDSADTSYYYEYGKTENYGSATPVEDAGSPSGPAPIPAGLSGLDLETTYHYRVVATNNLGTTKGGDQTFTTKPAVTNLLTLPATDISQESVTLNAEYSGNGEDTTYYFEWGPTTAYGRVTDLPSGADAGSPSIPAHLASVVTDFEGYTTYHYRVVASNGFGMTKANDQTFTTEPAPLPEIANTTAFDVGPTQATLAAEINPNRWTTSYVFEYGRTTAYELATPVGRTIDGHGNSGVPVSILVAGLAPGTVYHFRILATNFTGTTHSEDQTFTTPDVPGIEDTGASDVTQTTAHLTATVLANASPTTTHFEYGIGSPSGSSTPPASVGSGLVGEAVGSDLHGLEPGTTYHVRAVAVNAIGVTDGQDFTFTTRPIPQGEEKPHPKRCRKGYVRKHGKCVRKHGKRKHRSGSRGSGHV
jgi:hypothetical protein